MSILVIGATGGAVARLLHLPAGVPGGEATGAGWRAG